MFTSPSVRWVSWLRAGLEVLETVLRALWNALRQHWTERAALRRFRRGWGLFIQPTHALQKNISKALQEPKTTVEALRAAGRALAQDQFRTETDVLVLLKGMFDAIPERFDAQVESRLLERREADRSTLRRTTEGASLLALYDAATSNGPMSPYLFVILDPNSEEMTLDLASLGAQLELAGQRNEALARKLVHAVPVVLERVYGRHLRMLWALSHLAEGEWPSAPATVFGQLLQAVSHRLPAYPELVEPLARRIRNAVAHTTWTYNPVDRSIQFYDQRPPRGSRATTDGFLMMSLDDFDAFMQRIWTSTMTTAAQLRAVAQDDMLLCSGCLRAIPLLRTAFRTGDYSAVAQKLNSEAFQRWMFRIHPPSDVDLWFLSPPDSSFRARAISLAKASPRTADQEQ